MGMPLQALSLADLLHQIMQMSADNEAGSHDCNARDYCAGKS